MFTGIVGELGTIGDIVETGTGRRLTIQATDSLAGMHVGDSIAVNGVCLTAVEIGDRLVAVEVVQESLDRSNLGRLAVGDRVDLERPMPADGRFDGHVVQGHVDGIGTVRSITSEGDARRMRIDVPAGLAPYVVEKGSIAVDGVSLTITAVSPPNDPDGWFEIVLIPHTLEVTVLGRRRPGNAVNLEVDVIAKYVERMLEART
jgi:riboflavin synthase